MPGELILVFDDGYTEDFEEIRPVLEERDATACFAVVPDWIGSPGSMDADQLRTLATDGHEVASHGQRHRYLQGFSLAADAQPGDQRVYVRGNVDPGEDHRVLAGDVYELTDGNDRETVEVSGKGKDEEKDADYVEIATPIDGSYTTAETVVRPAAETVADEVGGARDALRNLGFDPTTFVFPYDAADERAWRTAEEHYRTVANAGVRSLPNPRGTSPTNLRRYYLETDALTPVEIGEYLDGVARRGGTGVLAGHGAWETVPPERVGFVVDAAHQRDIQVTTFECREG